MISTLATLATFSFHDSLCLKKHLLKIPTALLLILGLFVNHSCTKDSPQSTPSVLTDAALLDTVQAYTFDYFWTGAHQASGMALERSNGGGKIVTSGGTGFGVMTMIVAVERGFITREAAVERLLKITDFLLSSERFHGAFAHWYNGDTGKVVNFSAQDDGGDLVETAFMFQGLLTVRQYFSLNNESESLLRERIRQLWEGVDWNWYIQEGKNYLTWHWSANHGFAIDLPIAGYHEGLIVYILAASSPTHPIDVSTYHEGWARNGALVNGNSYFGFQLPLGVPYGGPLFFTHYSFLGLNPTNLQDTYANYWEQNLAHVQINRAHCIENPHNYPGYGPRIWGLTASDSTQGYAAHSPSNDLGVISPTAALSSFPYTPEYAMEFLRYLYEHRKEDLFGPYGFYDAFSDANHWVAPSYLAIDQGPIVLMIENYRTGLLWNLFMSSPEIQQGLDKLQFSY